MKKLLYLLVTAVMMVSATSCKKDDDKSTPVNYPLDGLISYFTFDNTLADQRSNTPDGSNNGAAFTAGKHNNAITLNGTDQSVVFGKKTFKGGNNVSVALWFKTDEAGSTSFFIYCSDFGVFTSSSKVGMTISLPLTNSARGNYTVNTWTHLVSTYDGTDIKTYINGVLVETTNHPGTISNGNQDLTIGEFSGNFWSGSVDDLFIYNKALSQSEVTQLYNL